MRVTNNNNSNNNSNNNNNNNNVYQQEIKKYVRGNFSPLVKTEYRKNDILLLEDICLLGCSCTHLAIAQSMVGQAEGLLVMSVIAAGTS